MSRIIDKLRSKAYYAYEGFLDETINKATKFLASSTTKFITSTFTIELNYDLEDLSSDTVLYPLKIIEKHFGNKNSLKTPIRIIMVSVIYDLELLIRNTFQTSDLL